MSKKTVLIVFDARPHPLDFSQRPGKRSAPETSPIRQSQSPRRIDQTPIGPDILAGSLARPAMSGLAATGKKRRHQDGELVDRHPGKSVNSPTPVTRF